MATGADAPDRSGLPASRTQALRGRCEADGVPQAIAVPGEPKRQG